VKLWAGMECTVNRVGDTYFDQLERTGHAARISDLDLLADLGVSAARYPVLWERTAPDGIARADWRWPDERLARLRDRGITPIVGLIHHGSGPRDTSLLDPDFPIKLAAYARAVAERYPWIEWWTPVNEPLTTARFSGLYGHWYPHGRDGRSFGYALLNQVRGVVLAMQAIRTVNPAAKLVQTDDLGKTFSTPTLAYQARFDNERRWITFDLLCGRVNRDHPMWNYLRDQGVDERDTGWFLDHPCPPDVVGLNYYLTSERFLDERLDRYPPNTHGGNGRQTYADIEAVRVRVEGVAGAYTLLREACERYRLPLAVTEAHNGCTREEQLRWIADVWRAAEHLRDDGADVRAVTAWSLLGAYDWNSLVTRAAGHYEPGVFDLRSSPPRPTALAPLLRDLARGQKPDLPLLDVPGWWQRPDRLIFGVAVNGEGTVQNVPAPQPLFGDPPRAVRPVLITGATGTLGRAFARICEGRGIPYRLLSRRDMDIAQPASVGAALNEFKPWAVINAAGYVRVDDAESDRGACYRENADGPAALAAACEWRGIRLLTFSSDLVFDGSKQGPYVESDRVSPLNVYGRTKAEAERRVLAALPDALVIRTSAFWGPWDEHNFVIAALRAVAGEQPFVAADDAIVSPTYVPDLVHAALDLLIDGERGIWHLANDGATSWADLARTAATAAGYDPHLVNGRSTAELGHVAPRPLRSVLGSDRGVLLPSLADALARFEREREQPIGLRERAV
jgi:dTDP-4-dehydrorhamnose reductase